MMNRKEVTFIITTDEKKRKGRGENKSYQTVVLATLVYSSTSISDSDSLSHSLAYPPKLQFAALFTLVGMLLTLSVSSSSVILPLSTT
jgi:hypothetical protein